MRCFEEEQRLCGKQTLRTAHTQTTSEHPKGAEKSCRKDISFTHCLWTLEPSSPGLTSTLPCSHSLQLPRGHRQQSISSWRDLQAFPIAFHFVAHEETEGPSAPSPSRGTQHMKGVDLELASPVWHLPPQPAPLTPPALRRAGAGVGEGGPTPARRGSVGPLLLQELLLSLVPASFLGARTICWHQHGVWRFLDTRDQRLMHRAALTQRKCFSDAADNSRDKEHTHRQTQQIHRHTHANRHTKVHTGTHNRCTSRHSAITQTHAQRHTDKDTHRHTHA